ncbi:MAG TPA: hypothetical protein VGB55_07720 [Tepidisphaeraceae bacterium]|jgi:hypothetical protein
MASQKLRILCSGHLIRYPVGGFTFHHLQYLVGLKRLGHEVYFFENWGWPRSCYDAEQHDMTDDPSYGIRYMLPFFKQHGLENAWCYLAEDGKTHGMSRERLADICRDCDLYLNLSNINWIDELETCRRRVLVDTDPTFTQIGGHGMGGPFERYAVRFTYGEKVHQPDSSMPTAGVSWLPTRQPVVLDLWSVEPTPPNAIFSTIMNWTAYGDKEFEGRVYGQKDRQFEPFFDLPKRVSQDLSIAIGSPPEQVTKRLSAEGWTLLDSKEISKTPATYQDFIRNSKAEFCVAKHGYVSTRCGWFSDRSTAYLASGRPVVVQDTGFSDFLPTGQGLMAFNCPDEAIDAIDKVNSDYATHCVAARRVAEEHFDSDRVLTHLLERSA